MRRRALVGGAMSIAMLGFAACAPQGGGSDSDGEMEVTWQSAPNYSLQGTNESSTGYLAEVIEKYESSTGNKVVPDVQSADVAPAMSKLLQQAASGNAPDVAMVDGFLFPRFEELASPVDQQLEAAGIEVDSFLAPFRDALSGPDGAKGMQFTTDVRIMYYRKDLIPTPPTTWDEVLEVGKDLQQQGLTFQYPAGRGEDAVITTIWPSLYAAGGSIFNEDGSLGFASGDGYQAVLETLEFIKETVDSGITPTAVSTYIDNEGFVPDLLAGTIGMTYGGTWQVGYLEQLAEEAGVEVTDMWGVAPLPNKTGDNFKSSAGGWMYVVFADDEESIDAAAKFVIDGFISDEGMVGWSNATGFLPTRSTVYDDPRYIGNAFTDVFKEHLDQYAVLRPADEAYQEVSTAMQIAMSNVASGQSSPKDALDQAIATIG